MRALSATGFRQVPAEVKELLTQVFSAFGSTKPCEDAFRELRRQETQCQASKRVSWVRKWYTLASSELLLRWHRGPLRLATPAAAAPEPAKLSLSTFEPEPARDPWGLRFPDITGPLKWCSFSPQTAQGLSAELQFLAYMHRTQQWSRASGAWRAAFFTEGCVYEHIPEKRYYLSLGHRGACGPAVLAWPLRLSTVLPNLQFFMLDHSAAAEGSVAWLVPVQWGDWKAWPCEVASPIGVRAACSAAALASRASGSNPPEVPASILWRVAWP